MSNSGIPILSIMTYLPLLGVVLIMVVGKLVGDRGSKWIALLTSTASLAVSLYVLLGASFATHEMQLVEQQIWLPGIGIEYHMGVDGLSGLMVLLTTLLSVIAIIASWTPITTRVKEYYIAMLLLEVGMLGVFVSLDFFLFYVFWEIMLIPMALLIGVWGHGRRVYSAVKFFLYTLAGSLLMLVAIIALYFQYAQQTGTYTLNVLALTNPPTPYPFAFQWWVFLAFFIAFAIKVPLFPFHTWLPDAHVDAPTAGSVILAGVLLKMGGYGFLRFSLPMLPDAAYAFAPMIIGLSLVAIIYGAFVALVQKDLKKLVAYSSVSHMGFVMLGIFVFNLQGIQGAVMQMFSHGLVTGGLFLLVGMVYERLHTRQIADMGGLGTRMPAYAAFFGIFMLASVGLPGLSGFVGEFLVFLGAFKANWMIGVVASIVIILAAFYMLWMYQRVVMGEPKESHAGLPDVDWREVVTLVPLAVLILVVGFYPAPFLNMVDPTVKHILDQVTPHATNVAFTLFGR